ncbi:MAG: hypothetical protein IKH69_02440 [Bacteroidaceae bacterium]|nr:hypothetical protein [Bacteroidaceae bacterium]
MKSIFNFTIILSALVLFSCSSSDDAIEDLVPIGEQSFYNVTHDQLYWIKTVDDIRSLKKENGEWTYTTPVRESHGTGEQLIGPFFSYQVIPMHYYPKYLWFKENSVYSNYWVGQDFTNYDDEVAWYEFARGQCDDSESQFENTIWLSLANTLHYQEVGNMLNMTLDYYQPLQSKGFRYVLEKLDSNMLIMRIEFPEPYFKCDGIRVVYSNANKTPKFYKDFSLREEAKEYIKTVISAETE